MPTDAPMHVRIWRHAPRTVPLNIIAVITGGLALDISFGWPGQIAAIAWTFAVFTWLYRLGGGEEKRVLIVCTVIAGVGEVFLSLVWGLYDYQFLNVPLFVPPGHALLMTLGLVFARRLPAAGMWLISLGALAWAAYAWIAGFDRFGVVLFGIYAFCMITSGARSLYATMFVVALTMELYGTALGNWAWRPVAPWVQLTSANPPFSAGAFYCMLDLLVLGAMRLWANWFGDAAAKVERVV
ncbi:MAG: hypothetical protein ABI790_05845 [Betaproteobacteria bacterium]